MPDRDPDFVGNGKVIKTQYGSLLKMTFSRESLQHMLSLLGEDYNFVSVNICEKKKPSPKGYTYYAKVDRWRPDSEDQRPEQEPEDVSQDPADYDVDSNLPF